MSDKNNQHSTVEVLASKDAKAIIAGCTEILLVAAQFVMSVPLIDPALVLTEAAVRAVKGAKNSDWGYS